METLFDIPEQLSPRLAWMQRHKIKTRHDPEMTGEDEDETGCLMLPWHCGFENDIMLMGSGMTEDEAIADFARFQGLRLWNEEAQPSRDNA